MQDSTTATPQISISALWMDKRWRGVIMQIVTMAVLVAVVTYLLTNLFANAEAQGLVLSFNFLSEPSHYDINQALIDYNSTMTHGRAALVGILNTALVAVCGIILTTMVGFLGGVLSLSSNWLVRKIVYVYVEFCRNVPVLVQILLWYAVILKLPRDPVIMAESIFLSNRGFFLPKPIFEPAFWGVVIALLIAIVAAWLLKRHADAKQAATGKRYPAGLYGLALIVFLPLLAYGALGAPMTLEIPEATRFSVRGGLLLRPEFVALTVALAFYTAAFITEIVRSGISSVSRGQTEAAYALGVKPSWTMRLIILPQALRVIIPPLTSQYLNLTKNSSLAIAIGYMDIMATLGGITLNQTGQAVVCIMLAMLIYLSFSLFISMLMNIYNRHVKLVER